MGRPPRPWVRVLALAAAGVVAAGVLWAYDSGPRRPPDIVLLVWDTCRADRLSAFGHPRPTTPRLEALARDGVRFERCFTPAPWTSPAHASLFTGLVPHRHGLRTGGGDRVRPGIPLLAETLSAAGYETVGFTANGYISSLTGLDRGFRTFEATYDAATGAHDAERSRRAVARWLEDRRPDPPRDGPYFVFINMMDLHQPLVPPPADVGAVLGPGIGTGALRKASGIQGVDALAHLFGIRTLDEETLAGLGARYEGAARFIDRKTGEVLDLLEGAGLLRDALLVVTSDHGENLGEHGQLDHRLSVYEPVLHVPLVVRRPGRFEGGAVVTSHVSLMDIYPTILATAGVPIPEGTGLDARPLPASGGRGRPLLAAFDAAEVHLGELRQAFPEAPRSVFDPLGVTILSVRDPEHAAEPRKYLRFVREAAGGGETLLREELYDLASDPGEDRDLLREGDPGARAAADRLTAELDRLRR